MINRPVTRKDRGGRGAWKYGNVTQLEPDIRYVAVSDALMPSVSQQIDRVCMPYACRFLNVSQARWCIFTVEFSTGADDIPSRLRAFFA